MASSPQTLTLADRQLLAAWAADCAEHVLALFHEAESADGRVREAIEQTRAFACGELPVGEALRLRGGQAGAAARETLTPAAKAAAYAAEQAAAVAHMGAHALGAAGYAGKAVVLAAGPLNADEAEALVRAEASWQVGALTQAMALALGRLPLLGENSAGPLGVGRLSAGHIGQTIRAVQSELRHQVPGSPLSPNATRHT